MPRFLATSVKELSYAIARRLDVNWYLDWGGGLLRAAVGEPEDDGPP